MIYAGWFQSNADPSLWLLKDSGGGMIAARLCCVDGMQIATKDACLSDFLVAVIKPGWPCTVQAADRFVGIQMVCGFAAGLLTAHQQPYSQTIVSRYACDGLHTSAFFLSESVRSPQRYLFSLSGKIFSGSNYPTII